MREGRDVRGKYGGEGVSGRGIRKGIRGER